MGDSKGKNNLKTLIETNANKGNPQAGEIAGALSPSRHLKNHHLQNTWTLWLLNTDLGQSWEDRLNQIASFSTVNQFWSVYYRIEPPSKLKLGSDYSLFKKNIRPMWEDPTNIQGGRWLIIVRGTSKDELDIIWLDVMLCLIGEACDHCDQICGAVVRIRNKVSKVSIWTNDAKDEDAILEIGYKLREVVRMGNNNTLQYRVHKKTDCSGSGSLFLPQK
ncbi:eukaryotic translation initiation factor 4E1-like [Drosophila rhopaloa]|uniref:eIF-4F 25 kDa subunit n=1 Tax=Drosophila rhopaloa TaxID=1041015 RepID=A0A6P4FIP6_DRORH|nr:eukaryotic translation initiation factor 4E1-like [Drosophila rhopaloa]